MTKITTCAMIIALLTGAPALAGGSVDYGRNENPYARQHRHRSGGAWIGNNRGHVGRPHGGHWAGGHGQFSPRGQGGYHWGW